MAKIITNRQLIATPPTSRLRYGVFNAATVTTLGTRGIGAGIQFLSDHCGESALYDQTCVDNPTKPFEEGSDLLGADPYWVVAHKRCGTVGRGAEEMLFAVREQLRASAQTRVEEAIWDGGGLANVTPTLTGAGATVVTPLGDGAGAAIAALEAAFYAASGFVGTIHINTAGYAALDYAQLIVPDMPGTPGVLTTSLGSLWSIGAGYGVTGPDDVAPDAGNVWAFMTAPVIIQRSGVLPQPSPRQTLDRALNQWDVVAEEVFLHTWTCPMVFAVQVPVAAPGVVAVA